MDSLFSQSRRAFLCAVAVVVSCLAHAAEEPVLRVGLMTDTHVMTTKASCERVKQAFELFKREGAEMIVHLGDLGQLHYEEGYRFYRETVDEAFPDRTKRPALLYVYANHELYNPKGGTYKHLDSFKDMKERVVIGNELFDERTVKGFTFLTFPQSLELIGGIKAYEEKIAAACAAHPGKPIFVLDHEPAWDTVYGSCAEGSSARRRVLNKYPQVIMLSGHVHNSNHNELCIWQGEFTAVDAGCLQRWHGSTIGTKLFGKQGYDVLVMEVRPSRVVFRRFDVRDGSEYHADDPWTVPLPFRPETAPYARERRAQKERSAKFAKDARIDVKTDAVPFKAVTLAFPAADRDEDVLTYRVDIGRRLPGGKWEDFARGDAFSEFYLRPSDRTGRITATWGTGYFESGRDYRFKVTPVGFFGAKGAPIVGTWRAPEASRAELVWESKDPMRECPLRYGSAKSAEEAALREVLPLRKGWYVKEKSGNTFVHLPEHVWDGAPGTRFRLIAEMELHQKGSEGCWLELRSAAGGGAITFGTTPPGTSGLVRYVLEYEKRKDSPHYALRFAGGERFAVRLRYLRIERVP